MNFLKKLWEIIRYYWKEANKPISLFEKEYWGFMKRK
jgi:hypothetical protein